MDKVEAQRLLDQQIARYRTRRFEQLARLLDAQETFEQAGPSGTIYQFEAQAFWDDRAKKHLRVMVSIDDRRWQALAPISHDFIMDRNGVFIGE